MRLVLLGPPGAGKGSLAGLLRSQYGLAHISTGDMLREEIKKATELGAEIKTLIAQGALVPDTLVTELVRQRIMGGRDLGKGFMLDGFPRTVRQAQDLDAILEKAGSRVDFALNMDTDEDRILGRLTGRRVCRSCGTLFHMTNKPPRTEGTCDACGGALYQRADDNEETIRARLRVYRTTTQPIIDYYAAQGKLKRLDGNWETDELAAAVGGNA